MTQNQLKEYQHLADDREEVERMKHYASDRAIEYLLAYHLRIGQFITNHLSEVTNEKGAVIGYELHLNMEETESLIQEIDKP